MKRYTYTQNNSEGFYIQPKWYGPDGLGGVEGTNIWIMAEDHNEANGLALEHSSIYFDGCEDGKDCECCGDRWYRMEEWS